MRNRFRVSVRRPGDAQAAAANQRADQAVGPPLPCDFPVAAGAACANYLFPAGHLKSLRGNSFLGIHNRTYNYLDGGVAKHATRPPELPSAARVFTEVHKKEVKFFATIGMSTNLDTLFTNYLERRESALSKRPIAHASGANACPRINLWVLRREQLESLGLKNIGDFWVPRTDGEQRLLQVYFRVPPAENFFGSAAELDRLCRSKG